MSNSHYKVEPDIEFTVLPEHVRAAKCGDPTHCTLALSLHAALDTQVNCVIEDDTAEVRATWWAPDESGRIRFHRSYLRTSAQALRILLLTDQNKAKLVRKMPPEGIQLRVEEHQSRFSQGGSQVTREAERKADRARRQKLAEDRAQGFAPPPVPRPGLRRPRATSRGLRGTTVADS